MGMDNIGALMRLSAELYQSKVVDDTFDRRAQMYRNAPAKWVYDELGFELHETQAKAMESVALGKDTAWRSGHKGGKTFLLACTTIWWLDTHRWSKVLSTAPGKRQLKHILWAEIGSLFRRWKSRNNWELMKDMELYHREYREEWFSLGIYSNEPGKIEGFHTREEGNLLIIVDEAKQVEKEFFDAVASMQGVRLMASVPPLDSVGFFYEAFTAHRELWNCFHMNSENSPFVSKKWLRDREKDWIRGSIIWQAKIEGNFPRAAGASMLIPPDAIENAQTRWSQVETEEWRQCRNTKPAIGCDVARFGDDRTTMGTMIGPRLVYVRALQGKDLMQTVGYLREMADKEAEFWNEHWSQTMEETLLPTQIPIFVDDTGVGGGVTDRLAELDYNVIGVNFGSKAYQSDKYLNRRSELWFDLAEALVADAQEDGIQLPPDEFMNGTGATLAAELTYPQYSYTSEGRKLEPKADIKKRLGRSPDFGDMLCLAHAATKYQEDLAATITII